MTLFINDSDGIRWCIVIMYVGKIYDAKFIITFGGITVLIRQLKWKANMRVSKQIYKQTLTYAWFDRHERTFLCKHIAKKLKNGTKLAPYMITVQNIIETY